MGWALPREAERLLTRSHGVYGRLLASVNGSPFSLPLPLLPGGEVPVDGGSAVRRTLKCEVEARLTSPLVDPLSAEVRAEYVLVDDPSGREYVVPVGTFVLTDADEVRPGVVALQGNDRWQRIIDARFEKPRTTSGNTVQTIAALLTEADDRIVLGDSFSLPWDGSHRASVWERDRDEAITKLARSIGCEVWFDPMGVAQIGTRPGLSGEPYWQITGQRGGAKIGATRGLSRSKTYNAVAVVGEPGGNSPAVYGVAYDTRPGSRTRYGGPFGKRPRFYRSTLISNTTQAQQTAQRLLQPLLGVTASTTVEHVAHPGLDAWDRLDVQVQPDSGLRRVLAKAFTVPLGGAAMVTDCVTQAEDDEEGAE